MAFDRHPLQIDEEALRNAADAEYMKPAQLDFFRSRLLQARNTILQRQAWTSAELADADPQIDMNDRATHEENAFVATALRDLEQRELHEIEAALARVARGEYGWCERTGEPIGIA
ncbi:MAG: RNA polymerase-binding protein DksA, partial [Panacagrimonas sp.]